MSDKKGRFEFCKVFDLEVKKDHANGYVIDADDVEKVLKRLSESLPIALEDLEIDGDLH